MSWAMKLAGRVTGCPKKTHFQNRDCFQCFHNWGESSTGSCLGSENAFFFLGHPVGPLLEDIDAHGSLVLLSAGDHLGYSHYCVPLAIQTTVKVLAKRHRKPSSFSIKTLPKFLVTFCKMWSASSAGMSTPSAAATANPSLTFAFYHCHILEDRPLIKYCRLSALITLQQ